MFKVFFVLFFFFFMLVDYFMFMLITLFIIMLFYFPCFYEFMMNSFIFIDMINYWLILLTLWVLFLMILSINLIKFNNKILMFLMIYLLLMFLLFSFLSNSYLFFYIFFEMSLIPTLYMILGWGYQPERILAGIYLLFYTIVASLPLLLSILFINHYFKMVYMLNYYLVLDYGLIYYGLILAFLVKMPMFIVHLWLPKAHVEAPIFGSMVLAAILLKLGGYGLLRCMLFLIKYKDLNLFFLILSIVGASLISLNCLRQLDLKMLIAYSSVAHMGMVLGGIFTLNSWGISGGYLMMIAHGLCSSGLFCLANVSYERLLSRSMLINKGMMNFMPSMALWWFLLISSNMSAPMSLNLISEIKMINSLISFCSLNFILLFFLCFFSASYCFYIYSFSQHGGFYSNIFSFSNNNQREYMLMMFHWLPLNLLFFKVFIV